MNKRYIVRKDIDVLSDDDERWLDLVDEDSNPAKAPHKNLVPAATRRESSENDSNNSPLKKRRAANSTIPMRIGLSVRAILQMRQAQPLPAVQPAQAEVVASPRDDEENFDNFDELDLELLREAEAAEAAEIINNFQPVQAEVVAPRGDHAEVEVANVQVPDLEIFQLPGFAFVGNIQENVAPQQAVNSYLNSYPDRDIECPAFLNDPKYRQHKDIFEQLNRMGARFLCKNPQGIRSWGRYPTHEKTFFQPMSNPVHQIYFPSSPKDIVYHGTWVSVVNKEPNGKIYPLHIITKNTLGAVNNLLAYSKRIRKIFAKEEFPTHWPHGLEKECVIVIVDNPEQEQKIFSDFEALVNREGRYALATVPNLRVYCKGILSDLKTATNCIQRNLINMVRPNLLPYAERLQVLIMLEVREINARKGRLTRKTFNGVCAQFFGPAPLSHELALTHFSLTELRNFYGVLTQSRIRMIELKGRLVSHYKGAQMEDPTLTEFLAEMDNLIRFRTQTINKLAALDQSYVQYSERLSALFQLGQNLSTVEIENLIYQRVQEEILISDVPILGIDTHFATGKELIAWLLTHQIPVPEHNAQELITSIVERLPQDNIFAQIRVF